MRMNRRLMLSIAVALVAAVAGVAYAAIPGTDGVISGCYAKGGDLRVIDAEAGSYCKSGETALSWNQIGQQGPIGPKGDPGLSEAYFGRRDGQGIELPVGASTVVATLVLPHAGNYVLVGHFQFSALPDVFLSCDMTAGSQRVDNESMIFSHALGSISLTGTLMLDQPTTATVVCNPLGGSAFHAWSKFEAIRVGTLIGSGGVPTP
jgi:hypothetical protein